MLLQFFVRDAQLLALGLQLLRLTLGFFQEALKLTAIIRRTHRDADGCRRMFEKSDGTLINRPEEAQFDY